MNKKQILAIFLLACAVVVLAVSLTHLGEIGDFLSHAMSIISPIIVGLCMAFAFNVILTAIETKLLFGMTNAKGKFVRKLKRPLSIVMTLLVAIGLVVLLVSVVTPSIAKSIDIIVQELPGFITNATNMISEFLSEYDIEIKFIDQGQIKWKEVVDTIISWLNISTDNVVSITAGLFGSIFDFILSFIFSIYVLANKEKIGSFMHRLMRTGLRSKTVKKIEKVSKLTYKSFARFVSGQFIEAVILGILCFIGMLIFRIPQAAVVSVVIGVTALIPIFGAWIGGVIGGFFILMEDPLKALFFIIFILVLQQLEGNIIYPKVVGESIGLPGILVLSAVIVGGNMAGIPGILFGVPLTSVIYTLVKEFVNERAEKRAAAAAATALLEASPESTELKPAAEAVSVPVAAAEPVSVTEAPVPADKAASKKKQGKNKKKKK